MEKVTQYPFLYENPLVLAMAQAVSCRPLTLISKFSLRPLHVEFVVEKGA